MNSVTPSRREVGVETTAEFVGRNLVRIFIRRPVVPSDAQQVEQEPTSQVAFSRRSVLGSTGVIASGLSLVMSAGWAMDAATNRS